MTNIKRRLDKLETSIGVTGARTICYEAALSTSKAEHERFLHEAVPDFGENDRKLISIRPRR